MESDVAKETAGDVDASELNVISSEVPAINSQTNEVDISPGVAAEVNPADHVDMAIPIHDAMEVEMSDQMDIKESSIKEAANDSDGIGMKESSIKDAANDSDGIDIKESSNKDAAIDSDGIQQEHQAGKTEVPCNWPVPPVNSISVEDEDPSLSSEIPCPYTQHLGEKSWPFAKHVDNSLPASSGLSRISSDADFCAVDSCDGSKLGGSVEGSEQCSRSQSPLSYVIQLNEDSECSLPSDAGTSNVGPTGFDKILIGQVNCEAESVDESSEADDVAKLSASSNQADSADLLLEVESGSTPSDATNAKESSTQKATRNSKQRNRRSRKNKDKEDQGGDDQKSLQSPSKNRQRRKVPDVTEVAPTTK